MNLKRFFALALAVLMLVTLAACGGNGGGKENEPAETTLSASADYNVTLVNALGKPYTAGIIVKYMQGGQQIAMDNIDENGLASKNLERGEYTLEIMSTDGVSYVFDQEKAVLSKENTELELVLSLPLSGENVKLFQQVNEDGTVVEGSGLTAYYVSAGCTQVSLTPGQRNYFVFVPKQAGEYRISPIGEVEGIGYYGSPFYMSDHSLLEVTDNSFVSNIYANMISGGTGTDVMMIGIDAGTATECILSIDRVGDPQWTPEQEPYVVYQAKCPLVPYTLPEGAALLEFDLTAASDAYTMVKDANGYYHLNDANGPLVLVKLGVDNKYTASYKTMLANQGVRAYFYDDNGNFLRREDYTSCLEKYTGRDKNRVNPVAIPGVMDEKAGVYPLNDDLMYIIQNNGRHMGWWDMDENTCVFRDTEGNVMAGINPDIAWLFMCCYLAQ